VIRLRPGSQPWREASFAVLDFESTGLDFARDHVLSYGVVPVDGGRVRLAGAVYRVVRPPIPLPAASIRVHGIRPSELGDAPPLDEVVRELFAALEGRVLVAHAAGVELGFLERIRRRHGGPRIRSAIDVLDLAEALSAPGHGGTVRLSALAQSMGVPVTRTHHALSDALTTAQLFVVLATRLEARDHGRVVDLRRAGRPQIARSSRRLPLDRAARIS